MKLLPIDPSRYAAFEQTSIREYAQSNIDAGRWAEADAQEKSEQAYRGKGYGKQAMLALEQWCMQEGLRRIALNVFAFNKTAIGLYESLGFQATNFQMKKDL